MTLKEKEYHEGEYKGKKVLKLCSSSCSRLKCAIFTGDTENENGDVCLGKCKVTH